MDNTGERVLLVSGDSHVGPSLDTLRSYCPREHLEAVPALDGPERQGYGYFAFRTLGPYA